MPDLNDLSERELEILNLLAKGKSNKEIAQELFISANTVKVHLRNIFSKLEISSRAEAILFVLRPEDTNSSSGVDQSKAFTEEGMLPSQIDNENGDSPDRIPKKEGAKANTVVSHQAPFQWKPWWFVVAFLGILIFMLAGIGIGRLFEPEPTPFPETTDIFSTDTNRWQTKSSLPTPRNGLAVVTYEDQIYGIGGKNNEGVLDELILYSPENDIWQTLAAKPTPATDIQAVLLGGKIYIPGGCSETNQPIDVLEIYDPRENTWSVGTPMPVPLCAYALVEFEGQLYLFGGWDGQDYVNLALAYSVSEDKWISLTPMPIARGFASAAVVRGRIFVIGGYDGTSFLTDNEIYIPELEIANQIPWKSGTPLPMGRSAMGVATIADVIYLIGGESADGSAFSQLEYSLQNDNWRVVDNPLADPWSHISAVTIGTQLYAIGGILNNEPTDRNFVYQVVFILNIPVVR